MTDQPPYKHFQRAPFCLLLYAMGILFLGLAWSLHHLPAMLWVFSISGTLMVVLASSFHHLSVEDEGDRLSVSFGPVPLFRRTILYSDIVRVEAGRTTLIEGWGIHMSPRGGWVWNLWGRDCVVVNLRQGVFRIGTDDLANMVEFLNRRIAL